MKVMVWAASAAALVLLALLWKHNGDARRDGMIDALTVQITADSVKVDSLVKASQRAVVAAAARIDTFTKLDTVWSRHRDTVTKAVDRIVRDTIPAAAKIEQLAALVEETKRKADSTIKAAEAVVVTVRTDLITSFTAERQGWQDERSHMQEKIGLLEKQSRHWGLVVSAGYGPQRERDGAIRLGLNANIGIGYRY